MLANVLEYRPRLVRVSAFRSNGVRAAFLLFVLAFTAGAAAQKVEVRILQAGQITRDPAVVEGQRLVGNVRLSVDQAVVACDSAWRYPDGAFRLMGDVVADDGPVRMTGDVLELDPEVGIGSMTGEEVRIVDSTNPDEPRILSTEKSTYAFRDGVATYSGGGVVTTSTEQIESASGTFFRDEHKLRYEGAVRKTMDTVEGRSEQVMSLPDARVLHFPMKAEVRHPQGGVSGSRGHWSMEVSEGWFTGESGAQARFMDGDVEVLADSLVLGDSLGLAFGKVAICDTLSRYRLHADSARFSARTQKARRTTTSH